MRFIFPIILISILILLYSIYRNKKQENYNTNGNNKSWVPPAWEYIRENQPKFCYVKDLKRNEKGQHIEFSSYEKAQEECDKENCAHIQLDILDKPYSICPADKAHDKMGPHKDRLTKWGCTIDDKRYSDGAMSLANNQCRLDKAYCTLKLKDKNGKTKSFTTYTEAIEACKKDPNICIGIQTYQNPNKKKSKPFTLCHTNTYMRKSSINTFVDQVQPLGRRQLPLHPQELGNGKPFCRQQPIHKAVKGCKGIPKDTDTQSKNNTPWQPWFRNEGAKKNLWCNVPIYESWCPTQIDENGNSSTKKERDAGEKKAISYSTYKEAEIACKENNDCAGIQYYRCENYPETRKQVQGKWGIRKPFKLCHKDSEDKLMLKISNISKTCVWPNGNISSIKSSGNKNTLWHQSINKQRKGKPREQWSSLGECMKNTDDIIKYNDKLSDTQKQQIINNKETLGHAKYLPWWHQQKIRDSLRKEGHLAKIYLGHGGQTLSFETIHNDKEGHLAKTKNEGPTPGGQTLSFETIHNDKEGPTPGGQTLSFETILPDSEHQILNPG
jgi:hypothetical protein